MKIKKGIGVSYASQETGKLDLLEKKLFLLGIKLLRYETQIKTQDNIKIYMRNMVKLDKLFIMLSRNYLVSPFCIYELSNLIKFSEKLVIVYMEDEDVQLLINNAINYWEDHKASQIKWLKDELDKIDIKKLLVSFSEQLVNRYIRYDEIINQQGIRQVLELLNYTPDIYISELENIIKFDDFYEREIAFTNYLKIAPPNEVFYHYKSLSYEKQGYIEGAVFFIKQAIELNQDYIIAYIRMLDLSIKYTNVISVDKDIIDCIKNLSGLSINNRILINKANGLMFFNQAKKEKDLKIKRKLLRKSFNYFKKAKDYSNGQDAVVFNNLGQVYEMLGNIKNAAISYQEAIKLFPEYYQALNNLALLFDKYLEDSNSARCLYEKCLDVKPDYTIARSNYALLMEKIKPKLSMEMYLQLLCFSHTQTDYITNLALILEEENISVEVAGILYKIVLQMRPDSIPANFNMGNYLRRHGAKYDDVMKYFGPIKERITNSNLLQISLSLLQLRENNINSALKYCRESLENNEKYLPAIFLNGYLMVLSGADLPIIANKIESQIVKIDIRNDNSKHLFALICNLLSIIYLKMGHNERSQEYHKKAYQNDERLKKQININRPYYGIDILEYEYPRSSNERIYKHRVPNLSLNDKKQILKHLKDIL